MKVPTVIGTVLNSILSLATLVYARCYENGLHFINQSESTVPCRTSPGLYFFGRVRSSPYNPWIPNCRNHLSIWSNNKRYPGVEPLWGTHYYSIVQANMTPKDSSSALTLRSAISSTTMLGGLEALFFFFFFFWQRILLNTPGRTLTCRREVSRHPRKRPDNPARYTQGWWFDLVPVHGSF